jgi:hypothetical protein
MDSLHAQRFQTPEQMFHSLHQQICPTPKQMFIRELPALKGKLLSPELEAIDIEEAEIQRHPEIHERLSEKLTREIELRKKIDNVAPQIGGASAFIGLCVMTVFPIAACILVGGAVTTFMILGNNENDEKAFMEVAHHRLNRLSNKIERIKVVERMKGPVIGENQEKLAVNGLEFLKDRCFFLQKNILWIHARQTRSQFL